MSKIIEFRPKKTTPICKSPDPDVKEETILTDIQHSQSSPFPVVHWMGMKPPGYFVIMNLEFFKKYAPFPPDDPTPPPLAA